MLRDLRGGLAEEAVDRRSEEITATMQMTAIPPTIKASSAVVCPASGARLP